MSGAHLNLRLGPAGYEVSAAVTGGQLVEPDGTTGKIKPATNQSTTVLGVALTDAEPAGTDPTNPLNVAWARPNVSVLYAPNDVDVTYSAAATFGQRLVSSGSGQVRPYAPAATPADTVDMIVGVCTAADGVGAAAVGRMRLTA